MLAYKDLKEVYEKHGFKFEYCPGVEEAKELIKSKLGQEDQVDFGGSVTLRDMSIYEELKDQSRDLYWHWKDQEKTRQGNVYLTSTNALTRDGKLVNMDGVGNRVTSMIIGYDQVYVIAGKNKLVDNVDQALERIRQVAAPLNAKRLNLTTPCVYTGVCEDCNSPERICRAETIIHRNPNSTQINIIFVEEDLGY